MLKTIISILCLLLITGCSSGGSQYRYVNTASGSSGSSSNSAARTTYTPPPRTREATVKPSYPRYIVQKGDTLSSVSRRSGISVYNITRFNQLKSQYLEIGQILYLPGVYKLGSDRLKTTTSAPKVSYTPSPVSSVGVIPRSKWAKYRIKGNITPMGSVKKITVHHTDDGRALSKMSDLQFLRAMENHHRNTRKWACIGYHFIIGRDGKVYEGRPIKYQGAHASSNNPNNVGISLIGNFNSSMPSKSQIKSLESLLYKVRKQFRVSSSSVYGHTHLGHTECPGKYLKRWIEIYRTKK